MCNISRQIKLFMYVHFEKSPLIDYSNDPRFHTLYMYMKPGVYEGITGELSVLKSSNYFSKNITFYKIFQINSKENFCRENFLKEWFPHDLTYYTLHYI